MNIKNSTEATATTATPRQLLALIEVINKIRMLKSWDVLPAGKADAYARAWAEVLNDSRIPLEHYTTLYKAAIGHQAFCRAKGFSIPDISAELFVFLWRTNLEPELRQKEIAAKNRLPETAESQCPRCRGTNIEYVYSADGKHLGCRPRCGHLPIQKGEWLWNQDL